MNFHFYGLNEKTTCKFPKQLAGMYLLGFNLKNGGVNNNWFLKAFSTFSLIFLFVAMLAGLLVFGQVAVMKIIHPTSMDAKSGAAIILPSLSTNTLQQVTEDVSAVQSGQMKEEDFQQRRVIFFPFFLLIPMVFIIMCAHEFGHYLICRRYGITVEECGIGMLCVLCIPLVPVAYVKPNAESLVAVNKRTAMSMFGGGISAQFFLTIIAVVIMIAFKSILMFYFLTINFGVLLFNALPFYPADGGQAMVKFNKRIGLGITFAIIAMIVLIVI